ncbi:MAG: SGNH/GDSL hydrolase family protein [Bacteroides sp.]|nr:SGNH/GDSL hydrolase family protein [Bacteroides sp.]
MFRRISACLLAALLLSTDVFSLTEAIARNEMQATRDAVIESQWKGKRVAFLGDSITDKKHVGTTKCYWEYLAEMLGLQPFVYGINGNRMDGVLKQARKLLEERGDSIDAIFIFAGTNDYNGGVPIGEWYTEEEKETEVAGPAFEVRKHRQSVMNDSTFKGRINLVMDFLKTNYPTKQVIMLTPLHRARARFNDRNIQPEETFPNKIGVYVDAYVQAVKEAANVWAIPVIDLNSICGLYPLNDAHVRYFHRGDTDRLHPNAEGHRRMALSLAYQLLGFPASFD